MILIQYILINNFTLYSIGVFCDLTCNFNTINFSLSVTLVTLLIFLFIIILDIYVCRGHISIYYYFIAILTSSR